MRGDLAQQRELSLGRIAEDARRGLRDDGRARHPGQRADALDLVRPSGRGARLERGQTRRTDRRRALGARRFAAALGEAAVLHGAAASRTFTLEDVNVYLAPFVDRLEEDALLLEARELLLSPAFLAFPRRGGLLRLELVLCAEVPHRLAARTALVKHLDGISDADIAGLNIPTGIPLLYELDDDLRPLTPGGRYLDPDAAAAAIEAVKNQGKKK